MPEINRFWISSLRCCDNSRTVYFTNAIESRRKKVKAHGASHTASAREGGREIVLGSTLRWDFLNYICVIQAHNLCYS